MLQSLRDKIHGWPAIVIFGILSLLLAGWGLGSYVISSRDTWVAKVGKHEIPQQEYQQQMNDMRQRMSQEQGDQFDSSYFQKPEVKQQVLDGLIDRYLLRHANDELGLVVTDTRVRQSIAAIPAFQVDGHFDADSYRAVLANNRMSPGMFEQQMRADLETRLLPDAVAATTAISDADAEAFLRLRLQTRDLRYAVLPRPALTDTSVSDKQVAAYYKAHQADFMKPEQVALRYIELDAADIEVDSQPGDAALKARYEQEKNRFVQPEQRLVSHILIKVPPNASPTEQKTALAEAQKVDALARAKGEDFAALAEKYSDDAGSSRQGGDLGWLQKGVTNQAFQSALFGMDKGEVSEPVLSPEGYHIIWLRDVRVGTAKPFEDVRDELVHEMQASEREHKYSEVASKLTDLVYQDPTTLEPAAKQLDLPLQRTDLFDRDGGKGMAANPAVVKAAFSDNVMKEGNTSDPIELGPNHIVVVHVIQHKPQAPRPLASVSDAIRERILSERVEAGARDKADALFAKLRKGGDLEKVAATAQVPVQPLDGAQRVQPQVAPQLLDKAFEMPHPENGKPQFALASLGNGSFALLELDAVHAGKLDKVTKAQRQSLLAQMRQAYAYTSTQALVDALRESTEIEVAKDRM